MLIGAGSVSIKMIFKVLVSIALVLVSIEARPPPTNGKSLEQLIREFKDIEKIRHEALQVVLNKPEYKEDENMVKYMATLTEFDRVLVDARKAIKDVPSILNPTGISTDMVDFQSKRLLDTVRRLRSESEILKARLTEEEKAVSVDVLGDNEVQMLMASFGVSCKKRVEIALKMLMEITAQNHMRGMSYNSPSVSMSYNNGLSVPVANNVY